MNIDDHNKIIFSGIPDKNNLLYTKEEKYKAYWLIICFPISLSKLFS